MATIDVPRSSLAPPPADAPANENLSTDNTPGTMGRTDRTGSRGLGYIPGLEGIRAIAVMAVLLYHADVSWLPGGFLGVDMFFVLSGFLITSIVLSELDRTGRLDFRRFYVHRVRRLVPALLLTLVLAALLAAVFAPDAAATLRRDILAALAYATNWIYIFADQSYFQATGRPPMLQHLWSLAVEEQFYLIWPAVALLAWRGGGRSRVREWALAGALLSTLLMVVMSLMGGYPQPNDGSRVYFGTDTHASGLLLGAALATVWVPGRQRARLAVGAKAIVNAIGFVALGVVVLIMMTSHSNASWLYWGGFTVFSALVAVVIAAASHPASTLGRALGSQPLRYIGKRSYGLYLFHWPVFMVLRPELDVPLSGASNLVLRMAVTFALAELSYRYVEMPVRRGALAAAWKRHRGSSNSPGQPLGRNSKIFALASVVALVLVGFRLVTVPDVVPDYLGGLTEVSALGRASASKPGDPALSGTTTDPSGTPTVRPGVLAVGESVMLGASTTLKATFKKSAVDAAVGRQAADIVTRLQQLRDAGALRETVILHTGSNGYVERPQLRKMLDILSVAKRIVVVNVDVPREWQDPNNELIAQMVSQTPNAVLADWHSRAQAVSGVHVTDGVHLTTLGIKEYKSVISDAVNAITTAQGQGVPPSPAAEQPAAEQPAAAPPAQ